MCMHSCSTLTIKRAEPMTVIWIIAMTMASPPNCAPLFTLLPSKTQGPHTPIPPKIAVSPEYLMSMRYACSRLYQRIHGRVYAVGER